MAAAHTDTRRAEACGLNWRPRRSSIAMRSPSCEPAIGDSGCEQRAATGSAQFKEAGQAGRIGAGGSGGRNDPIVAGKFAFAIDLPEHPRGYRVQRQNGPRDPCEQVGPIVAPCDVRQFVQQHVVELGRGEVGEQGVGQDYGGVLEADRHRHGHGARDEQSDGAAYTAGQHPGIEVGLLFARGGPARRVSDGADAGSCRRAAHTARCRARTTMREAGLARNPAEAQRSGLYRAGWAPRQWAQVLRRKSRVRRQLLARGMPEVRPAGYAVPAAGRRTRGRPTRRLREWRH